MKFVRALAIIKAEIEDLSVSQQTRAPLNMKYEGLLFTGALLVVNRVVVGLPQDIIKSFR